MRREQTGLSLPCCATLGLSSAFLSLRFIICVTGPSTFLVVYGHGEIRRKTWPLALGWGEKVQEDRGRLS